MKIEQEVQKIKEILREILRSARQDSYAEKACSLNRATNLLDEILEWEQVDVIQPAQSGGE